MSELYPPRRHDHHYHPDRWRDFRPGRELQLYSVASDFRVRVVPLQHGPKTPRYTTVREFGAVGNGLSYALGVAAARWQGRDGKIVRIGRWHNRVDFWSPRYFRSPSESCARADMAALTLRATSGLMQCSKTAVAIHSFNHLVGAGEQYWVGY